MYMFERGEMMIAKYWKKIGLIILIIACIFNVMNKVIHGTSLGQELKSSAAYMLSQEKENTQK